MFDLQQPRHIPTLPKAVMTALVCDVCSCRKQTLPREARNWVWSRSKISKSKAARGSDVPSHNFSTRFPSQFVPEFDPRGLTPDSKGRVDARARRAMGFNRRKMEAERKAMAGAQAAGRRATDAHVLQDAERLISARSERQARRMPLLFARPIGAALTSWHHFRWVYCRACRTARDVDLRTRDRHRDAAVTSLIPSRRVARAGRMHRSPNSCVCPQPASPTRCGSSTRG
jgi:hypothetical protein